MPRIVPASAGGHGDGMLSGQRAGPPGRAQRIGPLPVALGVLLLAAVVFGLASWGRAPTRAVPGPAPSAPSAAGARLPMPTGDIPGWRQVFADDFGGHALDRRLWNVYWGQPAGDPVGWFDPTHLRVSDGLLVISAYRDPHDGGRWATGGLSTSPSLVQTYGKYLVRFRLEPGRGIAHALLLTPPASRSPAEVDFSEDNGSDRRATLATLHYGPGDQTISKGLAVDLTRWNTLGVQWTAGLLRYTIDGRVWLTMATRHVPDVPMALDIQTQAWPCGRTWERCPDAGTPSVVRMYVDWVVAYAPAGGS